MAANASAVGTQQTYRAPGTSRLISLDLFRGITVAGMILVNNPGNAFAYWPLEHAKWNGWTPTDLVFPFFLFIVGVSMVLSFDARLSRGATRADLLRHTLWRAAVIFGIGVALNAFPYYHVTPIRLPGVLQRIAVAYAFAAVITLWTKTRGRLITAMSLLLGYWILMRFVPVPGFGIPGRDIPYLDPDRNLVAWLDRLIIPGKLYEVTRDPEGLLSTLPSIATALLGVLTGGWLNSSHPTQKKATGMFAFGVLGLIGGEAFSLLMPINKNLWTSSYVVLTAGLALVVLAACYWVLDILRWRGWWTTPFIAFGMNAIGIYTFSMLLAKVFGHVYVLSGEDRITLHGYVNNQFYMLLVDDPSLASLLYSLTFVLICGSLAYLMYRKRIFLKV